MLVNLYIKNFILIDEINLRLSDHFNVFTGETGAGKSLFVDALNFVSGHRSTPQVVGNKGESTYVEAVFSFEHNPKAILLLEEMGLYDESDDMVVFSREMNKSGRSIARINRRVVNLKSVRDLLSLTLDIHSQHDTQYLLNEKNHLHLLQEYIHDSQKLVDYQDTFKAYKAKLEEISALKEDKLDADELAFAKFVLSEIENLNPSLEDYDAIDQQLKYLEDFEANKQILNQIESTLSSKENVLGSLYQLLPHFDHIPELKEQFNDIYYQLEDVAQEITNKNNHFVFDEYEYNRLNDRMLNYTKLIRKYGSLTLLLDKKIELETHVRNADYFDDVLIDLENDLKEIETDLEQKALALSKLRRDKAHLLESEIIKELKDLSLENAVFSVDFQRKDYSSNGIDDVKFMISMNKGMDVAYLSKVASGGELSRVMLGLKVVFSKIQSINTLIFDEIDTGVSGSVAFNIGEKMKQISKIKQVISITHLPAVAVCADHHYLISKEETASTTITHVNLIENKARIEHLATMMMGSINDHSIQAATTLLQQGQAIT